MPRWPSAHPPRLDTGRLRSVIDWRLDCGMSNCGETGPAYAGDNPKGGCPCAGSELSGSISGGVVASILGSYPSVCHRESIAEKVKISRSIQRTVRARMPYVVVTFVVVTIARGDRVMTNRWDVSTKFPVRLNEP